MGAPLSIAYEPAAGETAARAVLAGHLDNKTCGQLDTWLGSFVAEHGDNATVDLDFGGIEFVSSRAVTVIVFYVDRFGEAGGKLRITNLRKEVRTVLDRLGFGEMGFIAD